MSLLRKLFLIREIISKEDVVHFRRWRIIQTPWFGIYLHHILKSDEEKHMHDHPWDFASLILWNGYEENTPVGMHRVSFWHLNVHDAEDLHKITLFNGKPTWSLFFVGQRRREFGFATEDGWVHNKTYRQNKRDGKYG